MRKIHFILVVIIILLTGFLYTKSLNKISSPQIPKSSEEPTLTQKMGQKSTDKIPSIEVIAENLDTPWGMAFLPDGSMLVTERPGRVRLIDNEGSLNKLPVATLNEVKEIGEGGLLGITLHPDFPTNNFLYIYYTYAEDNNQTLNKVVRMTYKDAKLTQETTIVDKIPGAPNHNGGRIKFGPDQYLYITTGDAQEPSQAQDIDKLGGKILRVTNTGDPAPGNPFNNLVYSYGHRNPQGLAWDDKGRLWATEHGRSGLQSGLDEINLITAGKNYGWPEIQGDEQKEGMEKPQIHSESDTWAPAGSAFINNSLFFGGLRGETLYEAIIKDNQITLKEHFKKEFGRIRDVVIGPDGELYITTSNHDGRGSPKISDDKIIKINSSTFN